MGKAFHSRAWGGCCLAALLSLAGPAGAFAQEPPTEWTFSLGGRESNEFSRTNDGVSEEGRVMDSVNASLGLNTRSDRDRFGLFGRVGANAHREGDDRRRLNFGAGLSWDREISTQSRSMLSLGVDRGFRGETLSSLGILAPGTDTFSTTASWSFQHQATPRTGFSTSLSYRRLQLESDDLIPGSQIVPEEAPFLDDFPPLTGGTSDDGSLVVPDAEDDVVNVLATEGLDFHQTDSHFASAGFGINHRWSEYSSLGFDMSGGYRTFNSDTDDVQDRREGAQSGLRFWAQRRIGQSTNVGTSYQVTRSLAVEPATTIQSLMASYGYTPGGRNISLSFSGGASHYQAESGPSQVTPVANVSFSAGLTRTTRLTAAYRRQFSQSLGFGRTLLVDYANVGLMQNFGSNVDLSLRAGGTFGSDPLIEGSRYDALQFGGTLGWQIAKGFRVGTSLFDVRREQAVDGRTSESSRNLWTFFATYTAHWR